MTSLGQHEGQIAIGEQLRLVNRLPGRGYRTAVGNARPPGRADAADCEEKRETHGNEIKRLRKEAGAA